MQLEMSVTVPLYEKIKVADCLWYEQLLFKVVETKQTLRASSST